jgi:hypothetical protein
MQGRIDTVKDDFWTERLPFFTTQFPTYYQKPQQVHGRFHISNERYFDGSHEIIPLTARHGQRSYVMMHPYVLEPKLTFIVGLYAKPIRVYLRVFGPVGTVPENPELLVIPGFRDVTLGLWATRAALSIHV